MSDPMDEKAEVERLLFALYHEPMPEYEWTEQKLNELIRQARIEALDQAEQIIDSYWGFHDQEHTHTWHDKQDCLKVIRELKTRGVK